MTVTVIPHQIQASFSAPCLLSRIRAGFPSPAEDYVDRKLDLNEYLIKHPAATFYCWTEGESMQGVGIYDGDLLIVDRAEQPRNGDVVLASLDGQLTCKLLDIPRQRLLAAHQDYPPIPISADASFEIEGVVVSSVRLFRAGPR
ncbi:translesion error-prone DNA polymerase V autoproteolytic subunit [Billgrantia diversa]|uniref:LexA family protein n=1 Tax=Halomonas sp. MCCC 1A13316 TaxID=2733487 RepID=UPI0018A3C1A7|nr:translesion error-prone DNA polymerase V autoproteolytic subunit [Halomonas sp. MCCC 1A13316]QOR40233.1 translesion error-prone DNA polymerase V autoproteolytic subunit [Halomonas sp. MCCC 1A13316]